MMIGLLAGGLVATLAGGCTSLKSACTAGGNPFQPAPPLVLPSSATLNTLGPEGLLSTEMKVLNSRKDVMLGADLPPAIAPVNVSQVYIRDQQWILNGRPWENYLQTTRSLQLRSR
ncbi:MAG: hypothetical protein VX527_09850 [Planctomycetota bacterium]|nr:hypothetical protein [Planctomycetota bacterium]